MSACVINGLPNVKDYIHKHRERLMEEKRQKMIALEAQRQSSLENAAGRNPPGQVVQIAQAHNIQQLHMLQQLNADMQNQIPTVANVDANNNNNDQ